MKCHCCGNEYTKVTNNKRANIHKIDFLKCGRCGHGYHNYKGNIVNYHERMYRQQNTCGRMKRNEVQDGKIVPERFHGLRRERNLKRVGKVEGLITPETELLDIGAGGGSFAFKIKPLVKDVECTEVNRIAMDECERLGFKTYFSGFFSKLKTDKKYNLITAWHVLEHVNNPKAFMNKAHQLLHTKGFVVFEVPIDRVFGREFNGHLHYFTEDSIKALCTPKFNILELSPGIQHPALLVKLEKK